MTGHTVKMDGFQDYVLIRSIYLNRDYKENYAYKTAYEIYEEVAKEWAQMTDSMKAARTEWARREIYRHGFISSSDICEEIIPVDDHGQFIYKKYDISFPPYKFYAKKIASWKREHSRRETECH